MLLIILRFQLIAFERPLVLSRLPFLEIRSLLAVENECSCISSFFHEAAEILRVGVDGGRSKEASEVRGLSLFLSGRNYQRRS